MSDVSPNNGFDRTRETVVALRGLCSGRAGQPER
jgi:hypothetical protein